MAVPGCHPSTSWGAHDLYSQHFHSFWLLRPLHVNQAHLHPGNQGRRRSADACAVLAAPLQLLKRPETAMSLTGTLPGSRPRRVSPVSPRRLPCRSVPSAVRESPPGACVAPRPALALGRHLRMCRTPTSLSPHDRKSGIIGPCLLG